jgi:hypothetical protein
LESFSQKSSIIKQQSTFSQLETFSEKKSYFMKQNSNVLKVNLKASSYGIVNEAKFGREFKQQIKISTDSLDIDIEAYYDYGNDSYADLSVIKGDLSLLLGQEITSVNDAEPVTDYYPEYVGCGNAENYCLHIITYGKENETLHILSLHRSSGYYYGGSVMNIEFPADRVKKNSNARMIFVLGLPGSGKSTILMNNIFTFLMMPSFVVPSVSQSRNY